jgi:hypothetical protein
MIIANLARKDASCRQNLIEVGEKEIAEIDKKVGELEVRRWREVEVPDTEQESGFVVYRGTKLEKVADEGMTNELKKLENEKGLVIQRLSATRKFNNQLKETAVRFASLELEPIVLLAAGLWDKIAVKYLYRFECLDKNNKTDIDPRNFLGHFSAALILLISFAVSWLLGAYASKNVWCFSVLSLFGVIVGITVITWGLEYLKKEVSFIITIIGLVLVILSSIFFLASPFSLSNIKVERFESGALTSLMIVGLLLSIATLTICIVYTSDFYKNLKHIWIRILPEKILIRFLWPYGIDSCNWNSRDSRVTIHFRFQNSHSQWMMEKIWELRKAGQHPFVAVEGGIIVLNRKDISDALKKMNNNRKQRDPIIYTRHGNVVAIHAQFGEFAREKQVMDWARKKGIFCSYLKTVK